MPNKGEEEGKKRKLMAWLEVYGGQRSLAFKIVSLNCVLCICKTKECFFATPKCRFPISNEAT